LHQPSIQPNPRQRFCYPNSGKRPGRQLPINTTVLGIIGQTILLTSGIATPNLTTQPPPSPVSYSSHVAPLSQSISNIHQYSPTEMAPRRQQCHPNAFPASPSTSTSDTTMASTPFIHIHPAIFNKACVPPGGSGERAAAISARVAGSIAAPHRGRQQRPITRSITHAPDQTHTRSQLFHCSKRSRRPRAVATLPLRHFH